MIYLTRLLFELRTRVSPAPPNIEGSIPAIPYIFIMSCIRRLSSDKVIIEEIEESFIFSTLTSRVSLFKDFLNVSVSLSVISFNSSSLTSSLKVFVNSASIRTNFTFSFFCSNCVINGWSIASFKITTSIFSFLYILMY